MAKPIDIPKMVIRYSGTFDVGKLLSSTRGWLLEQNYEFAEPAYKHKYGDQGQDIEIEWEADRKVNYYVKEYIRVVMIMNSIKDVEISTEGKKQKMQQGRILVEVEGKVHLDYQKRFEGNKFLQGLQDFLHKYILRKTIFIKWYDRLYTKIFNLVRFIREQLGSEIPS